MKVRKSLRSLKANPRAEVGAGPHRRIRANDEQWSTKGPGAFPREAWPHITLNPRELLSAPAGKVMTYFMTPLAISSSAVRTLAGEGASIRYLTPDPVVEFVRTHHLYSNRPEAGAAAEETR